MKAIIVCLRFVIVTFLAACVLSFLWLMAGFGDLPGESIWQGVALWLASALIAFLDALSQRRPRG